MARSTDWQAEIDAMDAVGRAMEKVDSLPEPVRSRVKARVIESFFPGFGPEIGGAGERVPAPDPDPA